MSKSAIYAIYTIPGTAIAVNGVLPLNVINRRYGCNCSLLNNGIALEGAGYYDVDATVTVTATAADAVTVSLYQDGVPVPGATATAIAAAVGDQVVIPITAIVRVLCNAATSVLTLVVSGQAVTTFNTAVAVEKL